MDLHSTPGVCARDHLSFFEERKSLSRKRESDNARPIHAQREVAFQRAGPDTLVIDLDPQTILFDVGEHRSDPDADNIGRHILERPKGEFGDLIETSSEGVDIVPSHDMLGDFTSNLEQKITYEAQMESMDREDYPRFELLHDLLWKEEQLQNEYDAVLIDPNASRRPAV